MTYDDKRDNPKGLPEAYACKGCARAAKPFSGKVVIGEKYRLIAYCEHCGELLWMQTGCNPDER